MSAGKKRTASAPLAPGSTVGILGGGQLGRMLAWSAQRQGLRAHIFCDDADAPAAQVTSAMTLAGWDDEAALDRFAAAVDVVTLEFENVPVAAVERLARTVPVRPGANVLEVAQDRWAEKQFAKNAGIDTAPVLPLSAAADLAAIKTFGFPAILKTARLGYDGKGQARVQTAEEATRIWREWGEPACVLEGVVSFVREVSVLVARSPSGARAILPLAENRHENGILRETVAPARARPAVAAAAMDIAVRTAEGLALEGLVAIELFELEDGHLVFNEMAPRPHNSGHWTLDACAPDQFDLAIRAACDWPLPDPRPFAAATMRNLLGDEVNGWRELLSEPDARLHLYGKDKPAPGRKMGHVTRLLPIGETDV